MDGFAAVLDIGAPGGGRLPFVFGEQFFVQADGASSRSKCRDGVAVRKNLFVRRPVVRAHGEIGAPASQHFSAAAHGIAERVDEDVIGGHEFGELAGIVLINGVEMPKLFRRVSFGFSTRGRLSK